MLGQGGRRPEGQRQEGQGHEEESKAPQVAPEDRLRSWRLLDDFTLVDSLAIDTATTGVQQYDPIYKNSFSNIHLGNLGGAYTSNLLSFKKDYNEFIFLNSLQEYFVQPEDIKYYNSKVPYTNLTYIYAGPKRRSEENVSAFFTQNINKKWNLGFHYHLISSVGSYSSQQTDNRNFNFFMSYKSNKYSIHGVLAYNKAEHYENGGLEADDHDVILNPDIYGYDQAENIPVKYTDQTNTVENYQFFVTQSLGIGKIKINKRNVVQKDSLPERPGVEYEEEYEEEEQLPVSTVYHTMHLKSYKRAFKIDDLSSYIDSGDSIPIYNANYDYPETTGDTTRYTNFKNTFQIKFNEEANSLLKFGVRAYVTNEIKNYKYQTEPTINTALATAIYHYKNKTLVSTHLGGQVFKNIGRNFWWNVGGKVYVQGYKAGDIQLEGNINTLYQVFNDTAGFYARGKVDLRQPEFLLENYYSNHFSWNNNFKQEKTINLEFGLNIPTRDLKLAFESKSLTDYIYWNYEAVPDQSTQLINAFQVSLYKNFKFGALHSDNKLAYQYTSHKDLYPLPDFAGLSSNYFNFYLAKRVLNVQIGLDVKYHTEYYTPSYMPATGQFYLQDKMKIGNYPFMDAFMNLQLKRARIFLKFDHFNQSLLDRNYFLTVGYPYTPIRFKWGISWNFYD
ncbi:MULTISPECIES: putative porin [unclassified Saccharicrinis]|uniref:putative porin n=1 Tax=unclassified Saccharicrinis TaxID=2646859 RepID=UPI003D35515E